MCCWCGRSIQMAVICQTRPVAVDGFTGRAFHEHDKTWDW